jgi:hypothetical protein
MASPPSSIYKSDILTRKMKQKGNKHLKGQTRAGFIASLYAPIPQFKNGGLISKKEFAKKYKMCS